MYFAAGMDHQSGYDMLIYKICEAFQPCIPKENFFLILLQIREEKKKWIRQYVGRNIESPKCSWWTVDSTSLSPSFETNLIFQHNSGVKLINVGVNSAQRGK